MSYSAPLQLHVIWHPSSDNFCRPHAERIYTALNRDPYQPLVPGIGIPVFYRCVGQDPRRPLDAPAAIQVPSTSHDLRIVLLTPDFVLDEKWEAYLACCAEEIADKRGRAALVTFALDGGLASGEEKAVAVLPNDPRASDILFQNVLLQACRLLAHRPRTGAVSERGAAPLRLFLSHTKRDESGLKIAQALKVYFDNIAVDRFFNDVSIQPGDKISDELVAGISDSALIAIRTDGYVSSPWCSKELALAKRNRRPIVVIDALTGTEPRSSVFMSNLPSIRMDPREISDVQLDRVANFVGLEVLRFLYCEAHLETLKALSVVSEDVVLLPRPPEPSDLMNYLAEAATWKVRKLIYPDPVLRHEEIAVYAAHGVSFVTPISLHAKELMGVQIRYNGITWGQI